MECLQKHIWNNWTKESFQELNIEALDETLWKKIKENWDTVAKPLDGMGRFETLIAQIGAISGSENINIAKRAVIIMCSDNGIVEENISQSGQEVTAIVAEKMAQRSSSVGKMADWIKADTIPVDIGINRKESIPGVLNRKVRCGTRNFKNEPAMTEEEAVQAIVTGIEIVEDCKKKGYQILAIGEMGIGNTTTSSAVTASLLKCDVKEVTGRGAGLSDEQLIHKQEIIEEAIRKYELKNADAFTILQTVGGYDIAGLAGVCIGGALFHIPIVLDGVISMAAALLAERLVPGTKVYLLASHKGKEPAVEKLAKELEVVPVIDGKMALGEGTGALMLFPLLEMALSVYQERTTFSDIKLTPYTRYL